jgi:hypothetical protein
MNKKPVSSIIYEFLICIVFILEMAPSDMQRPLFDEVCLTFSRHSFTPFFGFQIPLSSGAPVDEQAADEIVQLRENLVSLTGQLDETNRAWQEYQQTQRDILRNSLDNCLAIDYNVSFDEIAQQIVDQITKERDDFSGIYQSLEKAHNELQSGNSIQFIDNFIVFFSL